MARSALRFILALVLAARPGGSSARPVTGFIPINDLGPRLYLNQFQGGLYANGSNQVPPAVNVKYFSYPYGKDLSQERGKDISHP